MADNVVELEGESKSFVDYVNKVGALDLSLPLEAIRELNELTAERLKGDFIFLGSREEKVVAAKDGDVSYKIPVTILKPPLESDSCWKNIMVYFHGGGWTWSSRNTHMKLCEMIARYACITLLTTTIILLLTSITLLLALHYY